MLGKQAFFSLLFITFCCDGKIVNIVLQATKTWCELTYIIMIAKTSSMINNKKVGSRWCFAFSSSCLSVCFFHPSLQKTLRWRIANISAGSRSIVFQNLQNLRLLVSILPKNNPWKSGSRKSKNSKMAQNANKI